MKIDFEAKIRIISEEQRRTEEECCRLRDENDVYRLRVAELSEFHSQYSPSTGEALIREVDLLASRVETLKCELSTEKSKNAELELSLSLLSTDRCNISTQTRGVHSQCEFRIFAKKAKAKRIRFAENHKAFASLSLRILTRQKISLSLRFRNPFFVKMYTPVPTLT